VSDTPTGRPAPNEPNEPTAPLDRAAVEAGDSVDRVADDAESSIARTQHRAEDRIEDARVAATERIRRTEEQVKAKVHETETKVREQVGEVQRAVGGGLSDPTPAGSVDEAAKQASQLRSAIDRDLDALQAKLPPNDVLAEKARTYGGIAVAVLAVIAAAVVGMKQRGQRKRLEKEAKAHAAAIARYLPQAAGEPRALVEERGGKGGIVILLGIAAAVGVAVYKRQQDSAADEPDLWGPA
jgi:hypothetical protein